MFHLHVQRQLLVVRQEYMANVTVPLQQRQQATHERGLQTLQEEGTLDEALEEVAQVAADLRRVGVGERGESEPGRAAWRDSARGPRDAASRRGPRCTGRWRRDC